MLNQKKVVISETQNLVDYTDAESIAMFESLKGWMEGYLGKDNGADAPFSDFYYPIMRQARDSVLQPENGTVVGTIIVTRPWHYLIQNILPEGSRGIHVVIGNKCNQSFTYEIDGPRVHFLGSGAIYETQYESMVVCFLPYLGLNHLGSIRIFVAHLHFFFRYSADTSICRTGISIFWIFKVYRCTSGNRVLSILDSYISITDNGK